MFKLSKKFSVFVGVLLYVNFRSVINATQIKDLPEEISEKLRNAVSNGNLEVIQQMLANEMEEKANLVAKTFSLHYLCAITTTKADIGECMVKHRILDQIPKSQIDKKEWKYPRLPKYIQALILAEAPPDKSPETFLQLKTMHFKTFYFKLMKNYTSPFFTTLRSSLIQTFTGETESDIYELFSATMIRDYSFFCDNHHTEFAKVLNKIYVNHGDIKSFLDHLFEEQPNWFLNSRHIQHINILRNAYHQTQLPEIQGYKWRNKANIEIEIPLYTECGTQPGYTQNHPEN